MSIHRRTAHLLPPGIRAMALAGFVFSILGCTLGPDPKRPHTAADEASSFVGSTAIAGSPSESLAPWWKVFGDPATLDLVDRALVHNTDLKAAAARVLESRAQLRQSRGTQFPQVSASGSANRSKSSFSLPQVGRVAVYSTTYSADLNVSYQLDLFGKLKRHRQSAWAQVLAQEASSQALLHTVVSEVVRGRVRLSILGRRVQVAEGIRDSWSQTLGTIERRYESGLVGALDLRAARENLASAEGNLVVAHQQLSQAQLALDVLVGSRPGTGELPTELLDPLPNLEPVPLGLPADLLDRRPDLRQAEMQLASATSQVGVAMADLFPSLSLTGSGGTRSDSLSDLVSSDALVYNAIAGLVAPIFNGGQRRAAVEAAEARADQAAAAYAGAVLRSLREVEDALVRDQSLRRQLLFLDQRLIEAQAADRIARDRYQRGVSPLLQVLDSERRRRAAEDALNAAQGEMWNARIDLHLALGGDWGIDPTTDGPITDSETDSPTDSSTNSSSASDSVDEAAAQEAEKEEAR